MRKWAACSLVFALAACNQQAPATFAIAHGPGPVERVECRQGECYWTQRQSVTILKSETDGILLKVAGRAGNSVHGVEAEPPEKWDPGIKVEWQPETSFFLCSLDHPAMLWRSDDEFLLDKLDLHTLPGVQVASANEYMAACHSLAPEKWDEKALEKLGYVKAAGDQGHYATLEAALKAMGR